MFEIPCSFACQITILQSVSSPADLHLNVHLPRLYHKRCNPEVINKVISLCSGHWQWTFYYCVSVHSSHHKLSFEFQGPSNKQFKNWYWNSLQRQVKIHFWKIFKEIFLWSLYFLETQLYCWNLKTFRFVKTSSCNGHKESS